MSGLFMFFLYYVGRVFLESEEKLGTKLCFALLDTQEGMVEIMKLWRIWQEIQRILRQEEENEDRELDWGVGNLGM